MNDAMQGTRTQKNLQTAGYDLDDSLEVGLGG
jgi:hypothetical protein